MFELIINLMNCFTLLMWPFWLKNIFNNKFFIYFVIALMMSLRRWNVMLKSKCDAGWAKGPKGQKFDILFKVFVYHFWAALSRRKSKNRLLPKNNLFFLRQYYIFPVYYNHLVMIQSTNCLSWKDSYTYCDARLKKHWKKIV